jgi:hypothetical protein
MRSSRDTGEWSTQKFAVAGRQLPKTRTEARQKDSNHYRKKQMGRVIRLRSHAQHVNPENHIGPMRLLEGFLTGRFQPVTWAEVDRCLCRMISQRRCRPKSAGVNRF